MGRPGDVRGSRRGAIGSTALSLIVLVASVGFVGFRAASSSAFSADRALSERAPSITALASVPTGSEDGTGAVQRGLPPLSDPPRGDDVSAAAETVEVADGGLPGDATVFDDVYPGLARLDPGLGEAMRAAAQDASEDGVTFHVTSGWRSEEYQDQLFRQAVSEYGSVEEAARWVATTETSAHVSGEAVDIGSADAQAWLSEHGARYGLCQIYANEPWHYELRTEAVDGGCPARYPDPTQDPRMRQ